MEKIKFSDLSLLLKIIVVKEIVFFIISIIAFIYGLISGLTA